MHPAQQIWCEQIRDRFPEDFRNKRVLEVGSLDINGNNRYLFKDCEHIGLDVIPGKSVDVVCIAHKYNSKGPFDVVMSTNALEHDLYYTLTLKKMVDLLKPGGFLFFSVPRTRKEHGTLRTCPSQSGTSQMGKAWENYYKNLSESDVRKAIEIEKIFGLFEFSTEGSDLHFWGRKR